MTANEADESATDAAAAVVAIDVGALVGVDVAVLVVLAVLVAVLVFVAVLALVAVLLVLAVVLVLVDVAPLLVDEDVVVAAAVETPEVLLLVELLSEPPHADRTVASEAIRIQEIFEL